MHYGCVIFVRILQGLVEVSSAHNDLLSTYKWTLPLTLHQIIYDVQLNILVLKSVKAYFVKAYHEVIVLFVSVASSSTP